MKINCLSLLMTFTLLISVFSVKADAVNTKRFYFEALDEDTTEEVREYVNATKEAKKAGAVYTKKDMQNSVQYIEYDNPSLYKYNGGSFKNFLDGNSEGVYCRMEIISDKFPDDAFVVSVGMSSKNIHPDYYSNTYWSHGYEKNYVRNNIERTATRYTDSGKVYICDYEGINIGVVCDENDIPQYIVCRDASTSFEDRRSKADTENEEIIKLLDTFDKLYDSYHLRVYDDKSKYQYVFDFDFFVDVDKAVHGALPDDYVFEPHGLETMAKNTIKTIDGRAYRFSKYGVCTGLYTGWSNTKSGRRFFRRGELVTGKTTINGKEYEFDKNGYLK